MIAHQDFIAAALSFCGTPVVHMGRIPHKALDCVGLVWAALRACGLDLPPTRAYRRLPSAAELESGLVTCCDLAPDLANAHLLQVFAGREARHVVVPIVGGLAVHAWGKHGVVQITSMSDRVHAGWRIRGVA